MPPIFVGTGPRGGDLGVGVIVGLGVGVGERSAISIICGGGTGVSSGRVVCLGSTVIDLCGVGLGKRTAVVVEGASVSLDWGDSTLVSTSLMTMLLRIANASTITTAVIPIGRIQNGIR